MKKFIIAEVCVLIALAVGFWLGRVTGDARGYDRYYKNADKAWFTVQRLDEPPVTLDEPDTKRLDKVRAAYREVFDNYPDSMWADDAIYQLASRLPRTDEEAFALFRRLIRDYPDSEWADDSMYAIAFATYKIAEELEKTGTLESTAAYYDRALALNNQLVATYPGTELSDQAQFNTAMCYYGKGELNFALAQLYALREPFSDDPLLYQILYATGDIYLQKHEYEKARIEFQNVVDSGDPDLSPSASFGIPQAYLAEGRYQEAIEGYQRVIDRYPDTKAGEDAHFYMGWAYERLGKYEEAIAQLEKAVDLHPHNENTPNAQFYIAQLAYANKDIPKAIAAYQRVADNRTTYDYETRRTAQYSIGKIYEESGETDLAVEAYRRLITDFSLMHKREDHPSNKIDDIYIRNLENTRL